MRTCMDCGDKIPKGRLQAMPNAEVCVNCQEKVEASGRFVRHRIEVLPTIEGWEHVGIEQVLVRKE